MRAAPIYTTWLVSCHSPAERAVVQARLTNQVNLDRVWVDEVHSSPGGVEQVERVPHRLGDYFQSILTVPGPLGPDSQFRLVFQRRPDAGRFWKDLMVNILSEIRAAPETKTVTLDSKSDAAPLHPARSPR
ncbi:MAG TPA: hypothetical protein VFA18_25665 [Gemmataceae bacterium]|nr:hypothetical protein [Gemmataceae bacterium]